MKKLYKAFGGVSLVALLALTGCASILNESTQNVNVTTSDGSAIKVNVDGRSITTPGMVKLERGKDDRIFITDAENCTKETAVSSEVDNNFFINILSGGAFGSSTDFSTGKMWKYSENVIINCNK
jgi:hypothetical protein